MFRSTMAIATACVLLLFAGCGDDDATSDTEPTPASRVDEEPAETTSAPDADRLPSFGDVPEPVTEASDVEVRSCTIADDVVEVEGIITNHHDVQAFLQNVPMTVTVGGHEITSEGEDDIWASVRIGPGRRKIVRETVDIDAEAERLDDPQATCELGQPNLEPEHADPFGSSTFDPDDIELDGCGAGHAVTVRNTTDRPIGVDVAIEFFDSGGFSVAILELGQVPMDYSDGRESGPSEVALPPGEQASYPLDIDRVIEEGVLPVDGRVTSCEVVAAAYEPDPETGEVIVDGISSGDVAQRGA